MAINLYSLFRWKDSEIESPSIESLSKFFFCLSDPLTLGSESKSLKFCDPFAPIQLNPNPFTWMSDRKLSAQNKQYIIASIYK